VLAARRSTPPELAGRWEFPGGKVDDGESPVEALRRELREELLVDIRVGDELVPPSGTDWPVSESYALRAWWAEVTGGTLTPTGSHDQVIWLAPGDLMGLPWLDADRPVAHAVRRRLTPAV
jgi:8-oxo-dGTP diphosphatase